jgi:hypothetical protein
VPLGLGGVRLGFGGVRLGFGGVRLNRASLAAPVPPAVWSDLSAEGLIDARAPLPA